MGDSMAICSSQTGVVYIRMRQCNIVHIKQDVVESQC